MVLCSNCQHSANCIAAALILCKKLVTCLFNFDPVLFMRGAEPLHTYQGELSVNPIFVLLNNVSFKMLPIMTTCIGGH